jgi:peptidoglycan hydrolase CwlO-like protein
VNWNEVLAALVIGLPSLAIGLLAYRRSRKVDAVSEQSGASSNHRAGTAQVIEGLNELIDNLQEDNKGFRADIRYLTDRLDTITKERDLLKLEVARLKKRYGNNDE